MKTWYPVTLCAAMTLCCVLVGGNALAANISGRSSTVVEWFDTASEETALPVYEYLLFNATDLDGKGLNFRGYGRLAEDFTDETDTESRLYYAYLEKRDLLTDLGFKLGRQFIATTAGASLLDGIHLDYRGMGPVTLSLFGGGDVSYYEGYDTDDLLFGGELAARFANGLDLGLSYVQTREDGDIAKELIGLDGAYDLLGMLDLYTELQYSWITEEMTYFLGGAKYHRSSDWTLRAEYLYSLPVFSATSIYSVFAVDEYREALLELTYDLGPGLRSFARVSREFYEEVDDANVFEAGIEKLRSDLFYGYLTAVWRDDEGGQDLTGIKVRGSYRFSRLIEAGLGAHLDVLDRRLEEDDETTSSRLWADATAYFTDTLNLQAKVERVESDLWDEYYRGRVRLNITF